MSHSLIKKKKKNTLDYGSPKFLRLRASLKATFDGVNMHEFTHSAISST